MVGYVPIKFGAVIIIIFIFLFTFVLDDELTNKVQEEAS